MRDIARDIQTLRFWRWFLAQGFAALGVLIVLLEAMYYILPHGVPIHGLPLAAVIGVVAFSFGLYQAWPRPIQVLFDSPNTRIRVIKGDLFSEDCHLMIGTCDTFDTAVPTVIAPSSVQGQALERLYGGDVARLDQDLAQALEGRKVVGTVHKPGKQQHYGIGSLAILRHGAHKVYFLAYSEMNEHNEAHATPDGLWKSLSCLWHEVSRTANGETVAVPVIGGGQSRLSQVVPAQDSIRLMILSFMFASRTKKVCDELRVVVRPEEFSRLDRLQLQAFLNSMRAS